MVDKITYSSKILANGSVKIEYWETNLWRLKKETMEEITPEYIITPTKNYAGKMPFYITVRKRSERLMFEYDSLFIKKKSDSMLINEIFQSLWDFIDLLDKEGIMKLDPEYKKEIFS